MKHPSSSNLSTKAAKNKLLVLDNMTVKTISGHMSGKVGSIIHDVWRSDGVHYPGVFVSYEIKR